MTENLRLKALRKKRLTSNEIASAYTQWVAEDDILIFKKENEIWGHKASKRGNDVYTDNINYKFRNMKRASNQKGISLYGNVVETKSDLLFITLTESKNNNSIEDAWKNIGIKFNQFRSNLISKFGHVEFMRTWEAHHSGYPHIHCLIKFQDNMFDVFKGSKNNKPHWLVKNHFKIKDCWNFGFLDVSGCTSVKEALTYIGKYIIKNAVKNNPSENLTLALCWYHGKRAFSVSGKFFLVLLTCLCNSSKIINPNVIFLGCFSRSFVYGFVLNKKLFDKGKWDNELSYSILDHIPKYDKIVIDNFRKEIPERITNERCFSYFPNGQKISCVDVIEFQGDNDYGADIEYSDIETNNGKYTLKEKFILADMELDEIGFSSAPQFMMARKKIQTEMIKLGYCGAQIMAHKPLTSQYTALSNCKTVVLCRHKSNEDLK